MRLETGSPSNRRNFVFRTYEYQPYGQIRYVEIAHTQITSKISPTDRAKSARPSKIQPDRPRISNQVLPTQIYVICPYGNLAGMSGKRNFVDSWD